MKGKDRMIFYSLITISFIIGVVIYDDTFENYSDIITFLSIMIGFKITSLSILFNSPLKKTLYDRKIVIYKTELHRLRDFYRYSLFFEAFSIIILFVVPKNIFCFCFMNFDFVLGRHLFIFPILIGTMFCFYKVCSDLFKIFVYPTN